MSSPALLLDVAGIIVDALGDEQDMNTIKSFSLASRAFVPLCRKHIFSNIEINTFSGERLSPMTHNLVHLLSSRDPDLPNYIRKFNFRLTDHDLQHPSLPSLLQKITKLESLFIWSHGVEKIDWLKMPEGMRKALFHLMHLPTLTHLKILWFQNFPVSVIAPCANLISLDVEKVDMAEIDPPAVVSKGPRLQEYIVGIWSAPTTHKILDAKLANGNPALDFTTLKKLNARYEKDEDVSVTERVLKGVEHLEVLVLFVGPEIPFRNVAKMTAPSSHTLKTLDLNVTVEEGEPSDPLLGLCEELEAMSDRNVVETIKIALEVSTDAECSTGDGWGKLDKVLTKPGWSKLKHVSLDIIIWVYWSDGDELKEAMDALPERQLVHLSKSKTIDFKFATRIELI